MRFKRDDVRLGVEIKLKTFLKNCGKVSALFGSPPSVPALSASRCGLGARAMISSLLADGCKYPSPRQLQRSLAYLNGDLGHAALMAGKQEEAVDYFRSSLGQWTLLSGNEGGNSEFLEGQEWARDRLRELDSVTAVRSPRN